MLEDKIKELNKKNNLYFGQIIYLNNELIKYKTEKEHDKLEIEKLTTTVS